MKRVAAEQEAAAAQKAEEQRLAAEEEAAAAQKAEEQNDFL